MASIAATSRSMIKGFDSSSLSSRSSSLPTHIFSVSSARSPLSTCYASRRCRTTPRNVGIRAMSSGPQLEDTVKKTIAENTVVVYSKTWCSYSAEVKSLLKRLGVEPFVIELDLLGPRGPQLQKTLETLTGQSTVPNVFIGGKHIGGCSDTVKLHGNGELEALLSEIGATK